MVRSTRILVVTGDSLLGRALAMYLAEAGFAVTQVDGLHEAERLALEPPDVAVVDHPLNADVQAVVAALRAHMVPVVLLTHDHRAAKAVNVAACLEKPFVPRCLADAVRQALQPRGA